MHASNKVTAEVKTMTMMDRYPMFCYHCGKPVQSDNYKIIGINMYKWPDKLPQTIAVHKNCITAQDVIRYRVRCLYCEEWFSSIEPDCRFCGFQCEHEYWSVKQGPRVEETIAPLSMSESVKELMEALKSQDNVTSVPKSDNQAETNTPKTDGISATVQCIPQAHTEPLVPFVPRNEQGVVFLFGMATQSVGYHMLDIRSQYPDATLISPSGLRVEMEFEFRASNFNTHKHDPKLCYLVVCWIADTVLPLPVIELSRHYNTETGKWSFESLEV